MSQISLGENGDRRCLHSLLRELEKKTQHRYKGKISFLSLQTSEAAIKVFAESYTRAGAVCLQACAHMCLCENVLLGLLGKSRPKYCKALQAGSWGHDTVQVGSPN